MLPGRARGVALADVGVTAADAAALARVPMAQLAPPPGELDWGGAAATSASGEEELGGLGGWLDGGRRR